MSSWFQKSALLALAFVLATLLPWAQESPAHPAPSSVTLHLSNVDIRSFLSFMHTISGVNMVIAPDVNGRVTVMLDDVPWDKALESVLKANGLAGEREGNILRVMTRREEAVTEETCMYRLSNASADDVARVISPLLSPRGRIVADERTNMVIVRDTPAVLQSLGFSAVPASKGRCYSSGQ